MILLRSCVIGPIKEYNDVAPNTTEAPRVNGLDGIVTRPLIFNKDYRSGAGGMVIEERLIIY